ncbi:hypothetical protein ABK040_002079 [Willaertia magna]
MLKQSKRQLSSCLSLAKYSSKICKSNTLLFTSKEINISLINRSSFHTFSILTDIKPPSEPSTTVKPKDETNTNTQPQTNQQQAQSTTTATSPIADLLKLQGYPTILLDNEKINSLLKDNFQQVSKFTKFIRSLLQNAWIFRVVTIFGILSLLVVEEYMKLERVEQEFTTTIRPNDIPDEEMIERKELQEELLNYCIHSKNQYSMIIGESGIGKTELCQQLILLAKQEGIPVFYSMATERNYEAQLKSELGYFTLMTQFFHYVKKLLNVDSSTDIIKDLEKVGKTIRKRTGKRAILMIDNCHQLAATEDSKQLLKNLQELAKKNADAESLNIIFIVTTDDGNSVHQLLLKKEFSSRMRIFKIGELKESEARNYLEKKFHIVDKQEQDKIFKVTGFVPKYLNCYNQLEQVDRQLIETFIRSGVDPKYDGVFQSVAKEILEKGSIDIHDFVSKIPVVNPVVTNSLVFDAKSNQWIITPSTTSTSTAVHPVKALLDNDSIFSRWDRTVTFKDSAIEKYVRRVLSEGN